MKKVTHDQNYPVCSIARSLEIVGERWTFLILREALSGSTRFGEFSDALEISTDLLSNRLSTLVKAGIMNKHPYQAPGHRLRYEYHLTPAGEELRIVLGALQQWGDQHCAPATGPSAQRRSRSTGQQLEVAFTDESGRAVALDDVTFVAV
ncbi:winged helix-turn-helix transcriptional regulator [Micromonospora parathelypteridis]|uniref:DNA-binding HxlR family transcriptional regulator n=1 Tax=Micromonospora parathelypteridis TaxID=1839617 RepID=A0A840W4G7_9ACTN|nr:helix-turn-helix domain-containing protein [Micromonospora parathelypteridis]MBB5479998.1 DNA-binding HxlR family transcriptional regulator [Micromonospora parathelypteridis]